MDIRLFTRDCD